MAFFDSYQDLARRAETMPGFLDSGAWLLDALRQRAQSVDNKSQGQMGAQSFDESGFSFPPAQAASAMPLPMNVSGSPMPAANAGRSQDFAGAPMNVSPLASAPMNIVPQASNAMAQAQPPQPQIGVTDWLGNNSQMLMGLGAGIAGGRGWGEGISAGLQGAAKGRAADQSKANQAISMRSMYEALVSRGISPERAVAIAQHAAIDPKLAEALLPQALGLKPPATMEGVFAEQAYNSGRGNSSGPAGGGTGAAAQGYYDFLRQKNAAEKAGTTEGERVANAQLDLPGAVAQAQEQLRLTQEIRNHPGRSQIGWHDVLGSAPLIPGTKGYDAQNVLNQIKGGAFLEAFKSLKGGGAITEVEGKKATDAIARMERATSRGEFDRALSDYEGVIRLGIDRANQQAGKAPPNGFRGNSDWQQVSPGVRMRQVQ